jgi:hypothetical protein
VKSKRKNAQKQKTKHKRKKKLFLMKKCFFFPSEGVSQFRKLARLQNS